MIVGIDHLVLLCPDLDSGIDCYEALIGRPHDWRSHDSAGASSALFQLEHTALELLAPDGAGPMADRLQAMLQAHGPGLQTLVFRSDDLAADHKVLRRRGLNPSAVEPGHSSDLATGRQRQWQRMRLDDAATGGVRSFVLQRAADDPLVCRPAAPDAVQDLDHLVITTADPWHALAHYGARLGLGLTMDRADPAGQSRLMVLRAGASGIELVHRSADPAAPPGAGHDRLWGITWRTQDIDAANARLRAQGFDVSEVRAGRRPGTRVFTVRDRTLGVPTLVVQAAAS